MLVNINEPGKVIKIIAGNKTEKPIGKYIEVTKLVSVY